MLTHRTLLHIPRRLIVIWKRYNTSTNTQNHTGMNFTMSICIAIVVVLEVIQSHCNHCIFLFFHINEFNASVFHQIIEGQEVLVVNHRLESLLLFVVVELESTNMFLTYSQLLHAILHCIYNKQRTHDSAIIKLYSKFLINNVSDNTHILLIVKVVYFCILEVFETFFCIFVATYPGSIDKYFGVIGD